MYHVFSAALWLSLESLPKSDPKRHRLCQLQACWAMVAKAIGSLQTVSVGIATDPPTIK